MLAESQPRVKPPQVQDKIPLHTQSAKTPEPQSPENRRKIDLSHGDESMSFDARSVQATVSRVLESLASQILTDIREQQYQNKGELQTTQADIERYRAFASSLRQQLYVAMEKMKKHELQMEILRGHIVRRNHMLDEQRATFYKELMILREQLYQKHRHGEGYSVDNWGRYFDPKLSQGQANTFSEYHMPGTSDESSKSALRLMELTKQLLEQGGGDGDVGSKQGNKILQEEISRLRQELHRLETAIGDLDEENQRLLHIQQEKASEAEKEFIEELLKKIETQKEEIARSRGSAQKEAEFNERLKWEKTIQERVEAQKVRFAEEMAQVTTDYRSELMGLQDDLERMQIKTKDAEEKRKHFMHMLEEKQLALTNTRNELMELKDGMEEEILKRLQAGDITVASQIESVLNQVKEKTERIRELELRLDEKENEIDNLKFDIEDLQLSLRDKQRLHPQSTTSMSSRGKSESSPADKIKSELESWKMSYEDIRMRYVESCESRMRLYSEMEFLKAEIEKLSGKAESLKSPSGDGSSAASKRKKSVIKADSNETSSPKPRGRASSIASSGSNQSLSGSSKNEKIKSRSNSLIGLASIANGDSSKEKKKDSDGTTDTPSKSAGRENGTTSPTVGSSLQVNKGGTIKKSPSGSLALPSGNLPFARSGSSQSLKSDAGAEVGEGLRMTDSEAESPHSYGMVKSPSFLHPIPEIIQNIPDSDRDSPDPFETVDEQGRPIYSQSLLRKSASNVSLDSPGIAISRCNSILSDMSAHQQFGDSQPESSHWVHERTFMYNIIEMMERDVHLLKTQRDRGFRRPSSLQGQASTSTTQTPYLWEILLEEVRKMNEDIVNGAEVTEEGYAEMWRSLAERSSVDEREEQAEMERRRSRKESDEIKNLSVFDRIMIRGKMKNERMQERMKSVIESREVIIEKVITSSTAPPRPAIVSSPSFNSMLQKESTKGMPDKMGYPGSIEYDPKSTLTRGRTGSNLSAPYSPYIPMSLSNPDLLDGKKSQSEPPTVLSAQSPSISISIKEKDLSQAIAASPGIRPTSARPQSSSNSNYPVAIPRRNSSPSLAAQAQPIALGKSPATVQKLSIRDISLFNPSGGVTEPKALSSRGSSTGQPSVTTIRRSSSYIESIGNQVAQSVAYPQGSNRPTIRDTRGATQLKRADSPSMSRHNPRSSSPAMAAQSSFDAEDDMDDRGLPILVHHHN
eukprot:TRINITY_DN10489_c0_g1_i1.p1 TRINITY_DN10489_c0_g1~~TRINITY_DN10489_c0_g1_i1.p1  ORF type:complete len:1231 (-),score=246.82 TRINITY_DN10489_c0_g1_i1:167-3778(-)